MRMHAKHYQFLRNHMFHMNLELNEHEKKRMNMLKKKRYG